MLWVWLLLKEFLEGLLVGLFHKLVRLNLLPARNINSAYSADGCQFAQGIIVLLA